MTKIIARIVAALSIVLVIVAAFLIWYKGYRSLPQPQWIASNARAQFLYGSEGAEQTAGIPYWIWLALPRIFPEYMPGPGGYASLGLSWEETVEMPVGFSKKTVGYVRVAGNCSLCHAYSRPSGSDEAPTVFAVGMGHTAEVQALQAFFKQCAQDPRFNADNILDEVYMATKLSLFDRLLYRYILIPRTRERLLKGDAVIIDAALWQHSRDPRATPLFRARLEALGKDLRPDEKSALMNYLQTSTAPH